MFDSSEYAFADIQIVMQGRTVAGLRGIKYSVKQEKEVVYGAGNEPLGIQRGNKSYEGEITVLQSETEALQRVAGKGKSLMDLRKFDIIVTYLPLDGGQLVTDVVKFAEFTQVEKGMSQNDKYAEISLPFIALRIEFNK